MDASALLEPNASQVYVLDQSVSQHAIPHRLLDCTPMDVSALTTKNALQAIATLKSANAHQPAQILSRLEYMKMVVSAALMMNASLNSAYLELANPNAPRMKPLDSLSMDASVLLTKNAIQDYV